jgi:creatinine amidohydrolase/Fe(II)-dependent formamide hydrolase-like protein
MFMAGEMDKEDIEYFLSIGALEFSYVNEHGEDIYSLTEKAKEIAPELYEEQMKKFNEVVFSLWTKEMVDISFDDEGEPMISLHLEDNSFDFSQLDEDEKDVFEEILIAWDEKNKG